MPDMGDISGSVEAVQGGGQADRGGVGGSQAAEGSGSFDDNSIGSPSLVIDSQHLDPEPALSFVAPAMTTADVGKLGGIVGLLGVATGAAVTGAVGAAPLGVSSLGSMVANLEVLQRAAIDAQASMGAPGAFSAAATRTASVGAPGVGAEASPPTLSWDQLNPSAGGGGGGPG